MTNKFHTRANLSQALYSIIQQHYTSMAAQEQIIPNTLPGFVSEATHLMCYELAGIINDNLYDINRWENIKTYCDEVLTVINEATKQSTKTKEE